MTDDATLERWQAGMGEDPEQRPHEAMGKVPASTAVPTPASAKTALHGSPAGFAAIAGKLEARKKTVLLVDSSLRSRESRAKVLRTKGMHVDCVADADAARVRLVAETYNLILVDPGREIEAAEALVQEVRTRNSRQLVGFLVGRPLFVSKSLSGAPEPRPRRAPAPAIVAPAPAPSAPAAAGIDFGQMIRNAEAEESA